MSEAATQQVSHPSVRIDKWLWAVRLYKTRSLATIACRAGHVTMGETPVKASRDVQINDVISVQLPDLKRTVRVMGLLERRVGPKLVATYMEDLTPAEEYLRVIRQKEAGPVPRREKGAGRPTKKDRRDLDKFDGAGEG